MKTNELASATTKAAEWLRPNDVDKLMDIINDIKDQSARPLKKSKQVLVVRRERMSRPSVHFEAVFNWVDCDEKGNALTKTGRKMTGKFEMIAWK